ncbi:hypothetical protein [Ornithinibacillus scapharcae]|uniref:hypothetical protein n=1 Tax=Ornithinibacillus scapharcae TaxID=1147159 RepID=UPI000225C0D4|nr:hypothetical protein [Ornithinibacillus scapharcae]
MSITFSNQELQRIIAGDPIGVFYPYNLKEYNHQEIDTYISKVVGSFGGIRNLLHEADFNSYGSGYASYVDVFCWKRDGTSTQIDEYETTIDGIRVYINRLAPIAILGSDQVTKHRNGGSSGFIHSHTVNRLPPGDWTEQVESIKKVLDKFQYKIMDKSYLHQALPFQAKIPTILADPPYKIFDALFYWED